MSAGQRRAVLIVTAVYWIAMATGSHWPRLDLNNAVILPGGTDKWLHVSAYLGLTWLLSATALFNHRPRGAWRGACLGALGVALVYSLIDEWTQQFVPGRFVNVEDVAASASGALLGAGLWMVTWRLTRRLGRRSEELSEPRDQMNTSHV